MSINCFTAFELLVNGFPPHACMCCTTPLLFHPDDLPPGTQILLITWGVYVLDTAIDPQPAAGSCLLLLALPHLIPRPWLVTDGAVNYSGWGWD